MHTNGITICRKSSEDGSLKCADQPLVVPQVSSPAVAGSAPPPAGGTCSIIRSTIEARTLYYGSLISWGASRMQKSIGKVPSLPLLLQAFDFFPDFLTFLDLQPQLQN
jgi:hypothetical protein